VTQDFFGVHHFALTVRYSARLTWNRSSSLQHSQDPVSGRGGRQMLQGVAADDMAQGENPPVGEFKDFRQNIESGHYREI
jgi:hypothetical protein